MKKLIILALLILFSGAANAGFNGLTHHSRANCVNNESISWDWTKNWYFWVVSQHIDARTGDMIHELGTGWQLTWRSAAVHWGEGRGGWWVHGYHYMRLANGQLVLMAEETVADCSIYDGWWDKNK